MTETTVKNFDDLPLSEPILKAVQALKFDQLTPIQAQILPHTLANQDAIGQAQTGTGKTATFLITIIESLLKRPFQADEIRYLGEPRALVLAPTRELAQQILADCRELTRFSQLYNLCITGGSDFDKQLEQLHKRPLDILIGTPGRIIDWVNKGELFWIVLRYLCLMKLIVCWIWVLSLISSVLSDICQAIPNAKAYYFRQLLIKM